MKYSVLGLFIILKKGLQFPNIIHNPKIKRSPGAELINSTSKLYQIHALTSLREYRYKIKLCRPTHTKLI